jgi:glycosyltransferase involved in cell wall biosynthesis
MTPKVTVIISFFNKIDYLSLVLAGFARQTFKEFEIIIADDGSKQEVVAGLKAYLSGLPLQVKHVWHEDIGFRKNKILNEAIIASSADYLVFIDGDCVPHKDFVKDHFINRKPGRILAGRRVNLSEAITRTITIDKIQEGFPDLVDFSKIVWDAFAGESTHVEKGLRLPLVNKLIKKKNKTVLGCNFSLFKTDLLAVNGFDERYTAPCVGEDTDVEYRLRKNGIKVDSLNFAGIQYHLYHKRLSRNHEKMNVEILNDSMKRNIIYTPYGIQKSPDQS